MRGLYAFRSEQQHDVLLEDRGQEQLRRFHDGSVWSFTTACTTPGTPSLSSPLEWSDRNIDEPDLELDELERKLLRCLFRDVIESTLVVTNDECELFAFRSEQQHEVLLEDCGQE